VLDRILAVLLARTAFVVEQEICSAVETNWVTRLALGFRTGLLEFTEEPEPESEPEPGPEPAPAPEPVDADPFFMFFMFFM
jgi:hypothetical protein